ncbi:TetR/AcrR family transcriptional regulator [Mesorhizobium sp. CGMCC 1.15528]|uniref:TetR/AcrR family transcriptional regulator n=1 Tax=Mesorhizobium zhangyense TaxID=1776730 RepID=A0A7C9R7E1_9HYPH|nr:TetR/AcrR family transcriptional regulator [Mesorhizobium zhangyense]NGN41699.1 TetR/AcrR family transcriptional regulator [Mesorhizobium zhangyense]
MTRKLAKSAISQKRVLDAAAKIFRDYGYAGTTMRTIADEANLKAGSIYYHYKSKDELISAVLDIGMHAVLDTVNSALAALPADADVRQRIETAIRAHLSAIIDIGDYTLATRRVIGQVPEAIRAQNMRLRDSYASLWQTILVDAQKRGEFRADANITLSRLFILGALNWTVEWFKPGGRTIDEVAHEFAAVVLDGLGKPGNTKSEAAPAKARATPRITV